MNEAKTPFELDFKRPLLTQSGQTIAELDGDTDADWLAETDTDELGEIVLDMETDGEIDSVRVFEVMVLVGGGFGQRLCA